MLKKILWQRYFQMFLTMSFEWKIMMLLFFFPCVLTFWKHDFSLHFLGEWGWIGHTHLFVWEQSLGTVYIFVFERFFTWNKNTKFILSLDIRQPLFHLMMSGFQLAELSLSEAYKFLDKMSKKTIFDWNGTSPVWIHLCVCARNWKEDHRQRVGWYVKLHIQFLLTETSTHWELSDLTKSFKESLSQNYVKSSVCVCTERKERREILCSNGIFTRQLEISSDEIPRRTKREYLEERKHHMWLIIWRRNTWISNNALQNSFSKFSLVQRALSLELNHFLTSYEKITLSWHD